MSELPKGWTTCVLGDVAKVIGGGTPSTKDVGNFTGTEGFPWITPADLSGYKKIYISGGKRYLSEKGLRNSSAVILPKDTVLFTSRAPIGYIAIAKNEISTNQGFKSFVCSNAIIPEYLYFYLKFAKPLAEELASGTTFLEISGKNAAKIPVKLAPINEQRGIVAKLEKLLSHVDVAQERLAKIPLILKRFRQSVLTAACSGRLTADWRKNNPNVEPASERWASDSLQTTNEEYPEIPVTWVYRKLKNICVRVSVGHVGPTSKFYCGPSEGVTFLRSQNVRPMGLDLKGVAYITNDFHRILSKSQLRSGDLLIVRVGANRGDTCVVPNDSGAMNCANIIFARPFEGVSDYLNLYFQTPFCQKTLEELTTGSAQGVINTKAAAEVPIAIASLQEQHEIVRRVETLFKTADALQVRYMKAKEQIDNITQSILAHAFRGELVPQDPDDEPASAVLDRIRRKDLIKTNTKKKHQLHLNEI